MDYLLTSSVWYNPVQSLLGTQFVHVSVN